MGIGLIIFISLLSLLSIVLIFYQPIFTFTEKVFFKYAVARKVYKIAKDYDFYLLNHVAINVEGKIIHFDHLLFGNKYIYCIGANYYPIAINGKYNDSSWFQYKKNNKFIFIKNPMKLHRERVNYFSSLISSSSDLFVATIIVNDSCYVEPIEGAGANNVIININKLEKLVKKYELNPDVSPIEPTRLHHLVLDIHKNGVK